MAIKIDHILGMNARNYKYATHNSRRAKRIADSKLLTKNRLKKAKLSIPRLYRVFRDIAELDRFDFGKLPESFVVKPNKGLGGKGIIVVESQDEDGKGWITAEGQRIDARDLMLHVGDILEGRFSMDDAPDIAFVEERIRIHPAFEKYTYHGTPDVRIIVFNKVPVMAMLRIPTRESGGRANLFQGAVGVGVDLASGVTTNGIVHADAVMFIPGTRRRVGGIQIPEWDAVLKLAVDCQLATKLGYLGVDIVLQPSIKHPGKTIPKVLELNAQPGLKIQLCNRAGLRQRLERVEGLEVASAEKGIKIAKELFGDYSLAHMGRGVKPVGVFEEVDVVDHQGERVPVKAKVDTGAYRTSIDDVLAKRLGLLASDNVLFEGKYRNAHGTSQRPVIELTFYLAGRKVKTSANVADRSKMKRPMLIGRRDLKNFAIFAG